MDTDDAGMKYKEFMEELNALNERGRSSYNIQDNMIICTRIEVYDHDLVHAGICKNCLIKT